MKELDWYYNISDSELGFAATSLSDAPPSESDPTPSTRMLRAASKQKAVRRALFELSPRLQSAIEAAYCPGPVATQLRLKYGILAGLMAHRWPPKSLKDLDEAVKGSQKLLATAHKAFKICYRPPDRTSSWLLNIEK